MKRYLIIGILILSCSASAASAKIFELNKTALSLRMGLYAAPDAVSGYDQIFYRGLGGRSIVQLTSTDSNKSTPKWGPAAVTYYFYDRVENEILECEGRLFYYLEANEADQKEMVMGCVASDSTATPSIIEGYPLTGLGSGPSDILDYEVAEGLDLSYDYDGTTHEAYPIVVTSSEGDTIVLHDDQANLGSTNYENGFVTYYDDAGLDDTGTGWTSTTGDDIDWDGTIDCPTCQEDVAGDNPGDSVPEEDDTSVKSDTDVDLEYDDSDQNQETTQDADQTTVVGNENDNENSNAAEASGSGGNSSTDNTINISVTVEVNSTNTNTSSSTSSSDFDGTVSSNSTNTTSPTTPVDTADETPAADISLDTSSPVSGGMEMNGGGGCSLSHQNAKSSSTFQLSVMSLILAVGILWIRKRAYEQSL